MMKFTELRGVLITGGYKNMHAQAAELRTQPDVIIATPGRLLDHLTNSRGITIDHIFSLVLDEADRLLDLGFQDEVKEIIKFAPVNRQTLLFSATLDLNVHELLEYATKRPVHIAIQDGSCTNTKMTLPSRLLQEFIRIRNANESKYHEAILLSLVSRTYPSGTIVFFDTKVQAHRMRIVAGLCELQVTELHGNLTQVQRMEALDNFQSGSVKLLFATDLAARGIDISTVQTVINYDMPTTMEVYVHRIGRTARAGRSGTSCTLVSEGRRGLLKQIIKKQDTITNDKSNINIRSRTIHTTVLTHWMEKIASLESIIQDVLKAEEVAKLERVAEMEMIKVENIFAHEDEIKQRVPKQWLVDKPSKKIIVHEKSNKSRDEKIINKVTNREVSNTGQNSKKKTPKTKGFTRLQRRRQEVLNQLKDEVKVPNVTSSTKAYRKMLEQKEKVKVEENVSEYKSKTMQNQSKINIVRNKSKSTKSDNFLDDLQVYKDEMSTNSTQNTVVDKENITKKWIQPPSKYKFTEFDPLKLRTKRKKNKQKNVHAFKSKKKYKRR